MSTPKKVVCVLAWFACGYVASAQWAGNFYGEFGASGAETKGTASRSSMFYFLLGPIGMFAAWSLSDYPPMWDWPKHLFEYSHTVVSTMAPYHEGEKAAYRTVLVIFGVLK